MAQLLVIAKARDPANDREWWPGDVVVSYENNYIFQAGEVLPTFWQIDVPDITVAQARTIQIEQQVDDTGAPYGTPGIPQMYRRRNWRIQQPLLTPAQINKLNTTGQLTILTADMPTFVASIRRVRDGIAFQGF